jgi:hypothetical protein
MVDKEWIFVLGAQDPEMREIKKAISHAARNHVYAATAGGRCNPRTAYQADRVILTGPENTGRAAVLSPQAPAVFVECTVQNHEPALRVDHHHPGDPGYDKAPERYMEGSSLGQVLTHLEMEPTETQRLLAASDHCLTAAYQGMCPGVDPKELLFLRASWKARITGRSFGDVMDCILDSVKRVERHYDSEYGESVFLDPTEVPPDLAEGAAYAGKPIRYREWFRDGELKEMLKGAAPAHIERFMQGHQGAGREVYGNPYRGYAGAYIT